MEIKTDCGCTSHYGDGRIAHNFDCPYSNAAGCLCHGHFEMRRTEGRSATHAEQVLCPDCTKAQLDYNAEIQRVHTIDPSREYGVHILVQCKNHPEHTYSTKNIDYIGARSIFPQFDGPDCDCSGNDLIVVKKEN
jgi:hypothetical protein